MGQCTIGFCSCCSLGILDHCYNQPQFQVVLSVGLEKCNKILKFMRWELAGQRLTWITCNFWITSVIRWASASALMLSGLAICIGATLFQGANINAIARVALFAGTTVVIIQTLRRWLNSITFSVIANNKTIWANTCNGPSWQGIFDYTFLSSNAWIAVSARVLALSFNAGMLRWTISVNPTFWIFCFNSYKKVHNIIKIQFLDLIQCQ